MEDLEGLGSLSLVIGGVDELELAGLGDDDIGSAVLWCSLISRGRALISEEYTPDLRKRGDRQ